MTLSADMTAPAPDALAPGDAILEIDRLAKWFPVRNAWKRRVGWLKALDDVSVTVRRGEILGIVGESGWRGTNCFPRV